MTRCPARPPLAVGKDKVCHMSFFFLLLMHYDVDNVEEMQEKGEELMLTYTSQ